MKVLLIQDVAHVGRKGEIAQVADGYGLNYLIRLKKALKADSPEALAMVTRLQVDAESRSADLQANKAMLTELQGEQFSLPVEANESGKLFAKLDNAKVAEMISALTQKSVEVNMVNLPAGDIKEVGEYDVEFKVSGDTVATAMLNVTTDKA